MIPLYVRLKLLQRLLQGFALVVDVRVAVDFHENRAQRADGFVDLFEKPARILARLRIGLNAVEIHRRLLVLEQLHGGREAFLGVGFRHSRKECALRDLPVIRQERRRIERAGAADDVGFRLGAVLRPADGANRILEVLAVGNWEAAVRQCSASARQALALIVAELALQVGQHIGVQFGVVRALRQIEARAHGLLRFALQKNGARSLVGCAVDG